MGDSRGRPEFPAPPSEHMAPEPAVLPRPPLSADGGSHSSPLPSLGCTAAGWCEGRCVLVPFCPPPVSFLSTICPPPVLHLSHCCPSLVPHPHPHVPPQEPRGAAHSSPARNFSPLYCGQPAGMHGLLSPAIPPAIVLGDATDKSSRQKNTHTTHTQESFGPSNRGAGPANIVRLPCGVERPALLFLCHGIAERLAGGARVAASAGVVQMTLCAAGHLHSHLRFALALCACVYIRFTSGAPWPAVFPTCHPSLLFRCVRPCRSQGIHNYTTLQHRFSRPDSLFVPVQENRPPFLHCIGDNREARHTSA